MSIFYFKCNDISGEIVDNNLPLDGCTVKINISLYNDNDFNLKIIAAESTFFRLNMC